MTRSATLAGTGPANAVERLDFGVADRLLPFADHAAVETLGMVSDLSDQEPLYAAAAAVLATGAVLRDGPLWRTGTRILASHLLATALRGVVKELVDRTRPEAAERRGAYVVRKGRRKDKDFNSFPSGHTAGAVAVALAVSREHPRARTAAMALAGAAGAAQVARSSHFVSDVIAGAAVGLAADLAIDALLRAARRA